MFTQLIFDDDMTYILGHIHLQNSSGKTVSLNNHKYFTVIQKSDGYRYHVDPL